MSHRSVPNESPRLRRSVLSCPASSARLMASGFRSEADAVFLDLEDSVAADAKSEARGLAVEALNAHDWRGAGKTISVRVNALDTAWTYQDIIQIMEGAGAAIDTIILPKVGCREDIYAVDALVSQACRQQGLAYSIPLEGIIESAAGVMNLKEIAAYNQFIGAARLEALHFGAGDYAASIQSPTTNIGGEVADYPGDIWHYPLSKMVAACRANGITPIDCAYGDFKDDAGYKQQAKRARALGLAGKWAIHPKQIPLANEAFTPSQEEIAEARALLSALATSEANQKGAAVHQEKMIDAASSRMAQNIVAIAEKLKLG